MDSEKALVADKRCHPIDKAFFPRAFLAGVAFHFGYSVNIVLGDLTCLLHFLSRLSR